MDTFEKAVRTYDMDAAARRLEADRTPCVVDKVPNPAPVNDGVNAFLSLAEVLVPNPVPESVNVAGLDDHGRLQVFVTNPDPALSAVDRARLYEMAAELLALLQEAGRYLLETGQADDRFVDLVPRMVAAIAKAKP